MKLTYFSTLCFAVFCIQVLQAVLVKPRQCAGAIRHVLLSVGHDPSTSMIVTFASVPSKYPAPVGGVLIGTSPGEMNAVVLEEEPPSGYNLTVSPRRGNYGNLYVSPYYHHVMIRDLKPNTVYYYQPQVHHSKEGFQKYNLRHSDDNKFESELDMEQALKEAAFEEEDEDSDRRLMQWPPYDGSKHECPSPDRIRSFKTAPVVGSESVNLAIIGDLGQFPHSEDTMSRIERDREKVDAIILAGDIAYNNEDHRRWDTFFDFLDDYPIVDRIPLQVCPGNHDIDKYPDRNEIFLAYENRFRMPQVKPAELGVYDGPSGSLNMDRPPYPLPYDWGNSFYSFSYGPAHIIMINAYTSMEPNSTQHRWIIQELKSVDRTVTPWVLAVLHVPLYNTFDLHHHDLQMIAAKQHLEPIFVQHGVNLVFTGHLHAYLRTAAVVMEEVVATGPIHITVGAGGRNCEAPFQSEVPEPWVGVRDATYYGYGMFRIKNRTTAVWDWIHTGDTDKNRTYNEVGHSDQTLPRGPPRDRVVIQNQFFL